MKLENLLKVIVIGTLMSMTSHTSNAQGCNDSCEAEQSIVEIAVSIPDFSTLVTALTEADLVGALQGEGSFTVLATTNDAFATLLEGKIEALLVDNISCETSLKKQKSSQTLKPSTTQKLQILNCLWRKRIHQSKLES